MCLYASGFEKYASRSGCFREVSKESVKKDASLHHHFYDLEEVFDGEKKVNSMADTLLGNNSRVDKKKKRGGKKS